MLRQWRARRRSRQANRWHINPPKTPKQTRAWLRWASNAQNRAEFDQVQRTIDILRATGLPKRPTWEELILDAIWKRVRTMTLWGAISVLILFAIMITDIMIHIVR